MPEHAQIDHAPRAQRASDPVAASNFLHESPRVRQLADSGRMLNTAPAVAAQRMLAGQISQRSAVNPTRLPDALKSGIESLSGLAMDDVRVHRNSSRPAQLHAQAFAQGADIHLAPGQDRHLAHEAWHVVQQKQGRVPATAQLARSGASASTGKVVQFAGHVRFANLSTDARYQQKGQAIIDALLATPSIVAYLGTRDALITLEYEPQLASVIEIGDQVQIKLSPWFFEQESRGRIVGMLAHEFGVHPLARAAMTGPELTAEDTAVGANTAYPTGLHGLSINAGEAGQRDHVFAAVSTEPRFGHYRQTVLDLAKALHAQEQAGQNGVTAAHVTDLIMTYLSDLAMILATNDHRGRILLNSDRTADIFNLELTRWQNALNLGDPVQAALHGLAPGIKTGADVRGEVKSLMGSFLLAPFRKSTSDANYATAAGGAALAGGTRIQNDVIADHGLAPVGPDSTLFEAIDNAGGFGDSRTIVRTGLAAMADPTLSERLIRRQLGAAAYNSQVDWKTLNLVGWQLNRTIRVLQPDGKMTQVDYAGPTISLAWVKQPTPHYKMLV
ncbi:eCIS core domain-containing protein [Sphingomonas soli]|uniref:eCIS core domain-containing protein n=1 Tax=Sphingomonas soli TaxID=266127 RepID=UPI000A01B659|nr:DUF4157 domain-containing protein [Sphingomonas soli]